jgi:anti-anti-sigma factor
MQVIATDRDGLSIGALDGRLDTVTAPEVERPLLDLVGGGSVVLDLSAVRYVSSAGLRVLLKAAKAARAAGHGFVLCGMQESVSEVYRIGGFERIISAYPDRDAALASLA